MAAGFVNPAEHHGKSQSLLQLDAIQHFHGRGSIVEMIGGMIGVLVGGGLVGGRFVGTGGDGEVGVACSFGRFVLVGGMRVGDGGAVEDAVGIVDCVKVGEKVRV